MVTATPAELLFSYPSAEPRIIRRGAQYEVRREEKPPKRICAGAFSESCISFPKTRLRSSPGAAPHRHAARFSLLSHTAAFCVSCYTNTLRGPISGTGFSHTQTRCCASNTSAACGFLAHSELAFCDNVPAIPGFQGMAESIKTATPAELLFYHPSAEFRAIRRGAQYEVRREKNRHRGSTTDFLEAP